MATARRPDRTDRVVERAAELAKPRLAKEIRRRSPHFKTVAATHIAERPKVKDEDLAAYLVAAWFGVQVQLLVTAEGRVPTAEDAGGLLEQLFHGTAWGTPLGIQESRGLAVTPADQG